MSLTTISPDAALEQAWYAWLTPLLTPTPILLSNNNDAILHPCYRISTSSYTEEIAPGTGVFKASQSLWYESKLSSDQSSSTIFNAAFELLLQALYWNDGIQTPTLQSLGKLLTASSTLVTVFGISGLSVSQEVITSEKLWKKEIKLNVHFANRK